MSVDFEAIAQRGRCDASSLKLAQPLLEQGFTPPFLARYRCDELGGLNESSLWALSAAIKNEQKIAQRRDDLHAAWQQTSLSDPAIGQAIQKSNSLRMLGRLGRRLKAESNEQSNDPTLLAVRVLNPQKGDGSDFAEIAQKVEGIQDATAAVAGLEEALAKRLAGDPRVIAAAVRWLVKNAQIKIANVSDPHTPKEEPAAGKTGSKKKRPEDGTPTDEATPAADGTPTDEATPAADGTPTEEATPAADATPASESTSAIESVAFTAPVEGEASEKKEPTKKKKAGKGEPNATKKQKKVSPRQRRRRWLVSILKPLAGKRFSCDKLSAFQVVMLGRALRSQVAECCFEYDAAKLVAELQRTAGGINRHVESMLREIVLANEAVIREAAEAVWWDDLHERASTRLVAITADHLRRHVNRGAVEAKVVMAIDAVGPRTAATSIVAADGRLLHKEDLPCQLSSATRSQAVARMGELIHGYHVDLIVISNGPARRATMIAIGDLISQSPEKSVRWTLADRSGADAYASSGVADDEMRSTPRRFRAAAWLAFSVLQPAQALAKVDPLKLRLSSFQRELSDEAMLSSLEDVLVSGASRGGVDVNSAPVSWLQRLPGVQEQVAHAIDRTRRDSLFTSRKAIVELDQWGEATHSRQALPFLRVFGSEEVLDGTLIHPDDYTLAKKLAKTLEVELPPASPQGYQPPDYSVEPEPAATKLAETAPAPETTEVEDFSAAAETAPDFKVGDESIAKAESSEESSESAEAQPESEVELAAADTDVTAENSLPVESDAVTGEDSVDESMEAAEVSAEEVPERTKVDEVDADVDATVTKEAASVEVLERVRRPRPEQAKIDKCVKEWQIGSKRANQLVQWLCDPFGDSDSTGDPPAVLTTMPSIKGLKQGDSVVGVVVGVMPFGVFVELAPDCSGLIHVSRVSDTYVEDLHEAVQVGDVVTAWVTGIDEKRRRVALSAVSPQREAELSEARRRREDRSRGGQGRGGQARGGGRGGQTRGGGQGGQTRGGGQGGQTRGGGRGRDQARGGRPRDGGRGRGARGRDKKPESYRVVGKKETKPISDAMQKGEEPLRSFGDLLQFYTPSAGSEEAKPAKSSKKKVDAADAGSDKASSTDTPVAGNTGQTVGPDSGNEESPVTDTATSATPPQSVDDVPQVEPTSQTEPAPQVADHEGSDSSPSSDKPAS